MLALVFFVVGVSIASPIALPCRVRREWGALTKPERLDYIDALFCLRSLPSILPKDQYPGVQDRFDDFVATHINYTAHIHNNGLFLPWHRHFLHLFETALRTECGYNGSIPYWNWPAHPNLTTSPLFDNSPTSLSGDGTYNPDERTLCNDQVGCIGRGSGGGCVTAGPFTAWTTHMGPLNLRSLDELYSPLDPSAFRYNPRCLMRSFNHLPLHRFASAAAVQRMLAARTIQEFLEVLDPSTPGRLGAHAVGHIALGPTMGDVFASVQDPAFFLHHAMVDRVWAMWQDGGRARERRYALNGTAWIYDPPWATAVTVDTVVEFGVLDGPRRVKELMDPLAGEYCYTYLDS